MRPKFTIESIKIYSPFEFDDSESYEEDNDDEEA